MSAETAVPHVTHNHTTNEGTTMQAGQAVLATTKHRGVFFGTLAAEPDGTTVTLTGAQMAIYWSSAMRGVFGLASIGPDAECRIGGPVPSLTIHDVTALAPCTDAAVARWALAPWR
jgi:hypothetical protein